MRISKLKEAFNLENATYFALLLISLLYAWFTPGGDNYHTKFVYGFLGIGIFFDVLSLFYHSMTLITRRYMSGIPIVGLLFYGWFLIAAKFSLVAPHETELLRVLSFKLADAAVLIAFHFFCQLPARFQGPRDKYN